MSSYWAGYSGSALILKEKEFKKFLKNTTKRMKRMY